MTPYLFTTFYYSLCIESSALTDYHTHYLKVPEMAHAISTKSYQKQQKTMGVNPWMNAKAKINI